MQAEAKTKTELYPVTKAGLLKFLLPSLFGLFVFLAPVVYQGDLNIPLGVISQFLDELLSAQLPYLATIFMAFTAAASTYTFIAKPKCSLP